MRYRNFTLDRFQEESIQEIEKGNSVVVSAPTGSGKTLIADYLIERYLEKGLMVIYTAPIKALSNQKYKDFSVLFGADRVGLLTGDITINPGAELQIMTTEIFRNMAISGDSGLSKVRYVILDEIHFINDIERGHIWEESIIFAPEHIRFLCLSATIPNADEFSGWVSEIKAHPVSTIYHNIRHVPLHHAFFTNELGITGLKDVIELSQIPVQRKRHGRRGRGRQKDKVQEPNHSELVSLIRDKAPILFFCFSRIQCQKNAVELSKKSQFRHNPEVTHYVQKMLRSASNEIAKLESARILRQILPFGIGFHHAGLLPQIKEIVEGLFCRGLIKVLYATETFAVGINMPAKTVCFNSLRKFDGMNFRYLNTKEYFQMAGRAGRRGIDREGFVYSMINLQNFEAEKVRHLTSKDTEPLKSQFRLEVNAVLNMELQHSKPEIERILTQSFFSYQNKDKGNQMIRSRYKSILRKLRKLGYLTEEGKVTWKGKFASMVFCDELILGEVFSTDFFQEMGTYQTLLLLSALVYEPKEKTRFYRRFPTEELSALKKKVKSHPFLREERRFRQLSKLTCIIYPCMHGGDFFDILKLTNMLEGDLIRFFSQLLDRISQILKAALNDMVKSRMLECKGVIEAAMKDISRY